MRILAIRGCNLASLAGELEIDRASGVLGFALGGPAGAGTRTLAERGART